MSRFYTTNNLHTHTQKTTTMTYSQADNTKSYSTLSVKALKEMCKQYSMYAGYSKHTKKDNLITFMVNADAKAAADKELACNREVEYYESVPGWHQFGTEYDTTITIACKLPTPTEQSVMELPSLSTASSSYRVYKPSTQQPTHTQPVIEQRLGTTAHGSYTYETLIPTQKLNTHTYSKPSTYYGMLDAGRDADISDIMQGTSHTHEVSFICEGKEIMVKTKDSINVEPTSVKLLDDSGNIIKTSNLRLLNYPDGHRQLSIQELSYVRLNRFKKDWDAIGKVLATM